MYIPKACIPKTCLPKAGGGEIELALGLRDRFTPSMGALMPPPRPIGLLAVQLALQRQPHLRGMPDAYRDRERFA